jgi:hypothetical protein
LSSPTIWLTTAHLAKPIGSAETLATLSGRVNEHFFTYGFVSYRYNPVATTTILTHDSVDDTYMGVTLGVDNATILARPHRCQNLIKAIHFFFSLSCVLKYTRYLTDCQPLSGIHESFGLGRSFERSKQTTRPTVRVVSLSINLILATLTLTIKNQNCGFHFSFSLSFLSIDIIQAMLEHSREKSRFLCQEILTKLFMIFIVFGTRFARANIMPNRMAQVLLWAFDVSAYAARVYDNFAAENLT